MLGTKDAAGMDRYVSRQGADDCLVATAPGDTVKVATGSYRDAIEFIDSRTLALSGGWSEDFSGRDPGATPTVWSPPHGPDVNPAPLLVVGTNVFPTSRYRRRSPSRSMGSP